MSKEMVLVPREPDYEAMKTAQILSNMTPPDLKPSAVRDICRHYHRCLVYNATGIKVNK